MPSGVVSSHPEPCLFIQETAGGGSRKLSWPSMKVLSLVKGPWTQLCALPAVGMGMPLLPRGWGCCDLVTTESVFDREGPQPSGMSTEGGGPPETTRSSLTSVIHWASESPSLGSDSLILRCSILWILRSKELKNLDYFASLTVAWDSGLSLSPAPWTCFSTLSFALKAASQPQKIYLVSFSLSHEPLPLV